MAHHDLRGSHVSEETSKQKNTVSRVEETPIDGERQEIVSLIEGVDEEVCGEGSGAKLAEHVRRMKLESLIWDGRYAIEPESNAQQRHRQRHRDETATAASESV